MVCHLQTFIALIVISDSYRMLESHFPQFPNENALFHHIQSSYSTHPYCPTNQVYILSVTNYRQRMNTL